MSANVSTAREVCERECARTFHGEHGGALPGGPFPGTNGHEGDVRRCEHGRVWEFEPQVLYTAGIDVWRLISPWWEPLRYRRAVRALAEGGVS
jgi:hypothetical protein